MIENLFALSAFHMYLMPLAAFSRLSFTSLLCVIVGLIKEGLAQMLCHPEGGTGICGILWPIDTTHQLLLQAFRVPTESLAQRRFQLNQFIPVDCAKPCPLNPAYESLVG